jgi:hypothetical protein
MLVAWFSWQWVFLVHGVIALLTLVLALNNVVESRDNTTKKLDVAGLMTLTMSVVGVTWLITQGGSIGWSSLEVRLIFLATLISSALFVIIETRHSHPMFDFCVSHKAFFRCAYGGDWHEFQLLAADDLSAGLLSKWAWVQQYGDRYGASGLHAADIINAAIGGKISAAIQRFARHSAGAILYRPGFALMALAVTYQLSLLPGALLRDRFGIDQYACHQRYHGSVEPDRVEWHPD